MPELSGPYIGFGGAVWNLRPNLQVLSTVLPCHFHHSDTQLRFTVARHLSAMKRAVESLRQYYEVDLRAINDLSNDSPPQAPFPYVTSFKSLEDSTVQKFVYKTQHDSAKLLFTGELQTGKRIYIKFVQRYSDKAHSLCASMGFAPALIGYERVPGGWFIVVMDALDEEYEELPRGPLPSSFADEITAKITLLHQAGYVHGDIRDTNVMVRKDGQKGFMLVDFDWAGEISEARYPMYVNRGTDLWRPDGAQDGNFIMADHDVQMLDYMLQARHATVLPIH
jgi:serine/threonine protein kinase